MNKDRSLTTLFMLMSLDGKISTGKTDNLDFDVDFPHIPGVSEGLHQYYEMEQTTDFNSFNSGFVQAKVGVNDKKEPVKIPVSFIVIDSKPHLTEDGVNYFIQKSKTFYLVTTNKHHPAYQVSFADNLKIIQYDKEIDFNDLFFRLKNEFHVDKITIQTGGTLNAVLLRQGLIDYVSILVAPCLIGGNQTPTIIDGESFTSIEELGKIKTLELETVNVLEDSYIHLRYKVNNLQ
jgi:2,5-diamino-6-(ribosylamino)-4(3H)-pyrimidinone 5'-phosphate reductase